jgi:hypothetical protein
MCTQAFFQKHALKEDMLSILAFISYADLLVLGTEGRFNRIYCSHAVGSETNASSFVVT